MLNNFINDIREGTETYRQMNISNHEGMAGRTGCR